MLRFSRGMMNSFIYDFGASLPWLKVGQEYKRNC
jgi:hypothetical protein